MGKLTDRINATEPKRRKTFFDRLSLSQQRELLEARRAFYAGEFESHINATTVAEAAAKEFGTASVCTIRRWLEEYAHEFEKSGGAVAKSEGTERRKVQAKAPRKAR